MGDSPFSLSVRFQNGIEHSDSQGPAPFSYESRKGLVDIHAQAPFPQMALHMNLKLFFLPLRGRTMLASEILNSVHRSAVRRSLTAESF
jgi:hypothetical protein